MNKDEALKRAQELLDYYSSGKYKDYEEVKLPDGSTVYRFTVTPVQKEQPMNTNERDTHFQGAASVLFEEMNKVQDIYIEIPDWSRGHDHLKLLIAQFLYDFKEHVLLTVEVSTPDHMTNEEPIVRVPDLTEWPGKTD